MPAKEIVLKGWSSPAEASAKTGLTINNLAMKRQMKKGPAYKKVGQAVLYKDTELLRWSKINTKIEELKSQL